MGKGPKSAWSRHMAVTEVLGMGGGPMTKERDIR